MFFCSFFNSISAHLFQQKSSRQMFSCFTAFEKFPKWELIYDAIFVPTWFHFTSSIPPHFRKNDPKSHQHFDPFSIPFLFDRPFWEPSWSYVGHRYEPKTPPRRSKTPPGRPQDHQVVSKIPQDAPRRIFWGALGGLWLFGRRGVEGSLDAWRRRAPDRGSLLTSLKKNHRSQIKLRVRNQRTKP